jgi:hypothetical protein
MNRHRRRILMFGGIGVGAYLLALLATVPARLVVPSGTFAPGAVSGTVWRGEAALPGGNRLTWRFAPLRTLASLAYAADIAVTGAQTDLAGRLTARPRMLRLDSMTGRAGASLVQSAFPGLPFHCDLGMQVALPRVVIAADGTEAQGDLRSAPGRCTPRDGGSPAALPALIATARGPTLTITPLTERRRILARVTVTQGDHLGLTITPAGAALLPFASPPGGLSLETTL